MWKAIFIIKCAKAFFSKISKQGNTGRFDCIEVFLKTSCTEENFIKKVKNK